MPVIFDRPWLLLCEGEGDKKFFHKLIDHYGIHPGRFSVRFPGEPTHGGGNGKFASWLSTTRQASRSFRDNVKSVLIVSDKDDEPHPASFQLISQALANAGFPAPANERVLAKQDGYPELAILMLPLDGPGNLETICVQAATEKWDLDNPLSAYIAATPANGWRLGKQSKMKMQCILAATCETKPDTNLAHHWQERPEFHIPITSDAFQPIVNFLRGIDQIFSI